MAKRTRFLLVGLGLLLLILIGFSVKQAAPDTPDIEKAGDNLMIVAHPDDESIFAGNELLHEDYVVIYLTNGTNQTRRREFQRAMQETGDVGIILNYPDKTNGERDNWDGVRDAIREELADYLSAKEWKKIVTHNPDGEYGHIHHKMTNQIVTALCEEQGLDERLFYFGKYFKKSKLKEQPAPILSDSELTRKQELLECYTSQSKVVDGLSHILAYEQLQAAK